MIVRTLRHLRHRKKGRQEAERLNELIGYLAENQPERLVIVDLGFNTGSIYKAINQAINFKRYIGFEIQKDLCEHASLIEDSRLSVIHAAAHTHGDGVCYFEPETWSRNYKGGSSIVEGKTGAVHRPIDVPSIDFAAWLEAEIDSNDNVFVKMDIEGAEFGLFEHLIATDNLSKLSGVAVEWHCSKFGLENEAQYLSRKADIEIAIWEAGIDSFEWF